MSAASEQRRAALVRGRAVANARTRERTTARIEDLEGLLEAGVPLEEAVGRVGWSVKAAHSALVRRGHPLASRLSALVSRARRRRSRTYPWKEGE